MKKASERTLFRLSATGANDGSGHGRLGFQIGQEPELAELAAQAGLLDAAGRDARLVEQVVGAVTMTTPASSFSAICLPLSASDVLT